MKKYLIKIKGYIFLSVLFSLLETIVTSAILLLPQYLVDNYTKGLTTIWVLIAMNLALFIAYLFICYISNRLSDYRRIKFEKEIKKDFFNAVIEKDYLNYHEYDIAEYISMQANDITEMCQNYLSPLLAVFRSAIMILVFGMALVIFVNAYIAAIIIICSALTTIIPRITAAELSKRNGDYLKKTGKYTATIKNFFEAHDILDHKTTQVIEEIHEVELDAMLAKNMHFRRLNSLALVLNGGVVEFVSVISFITIAMLLFFGKITPGQTTSAFMYSTKFMEPIFELNVNIGRIKSVKAIQDKLATILGKKSDTLMPCPASVEKIETKNLTKTFKQRKLEMPDMAFANGQSYLLIGDNGVGKSVFFRMLMGFYKPNSGSIAYDECEAVNVSSLNAYVPQIPILFEGSYHDNVTLYGAYDDSDLPAYEACFPSEIIKRIKENENIQSLSGGEKQVITLLRALCSKKPVLLLDEPFSAMNEQTIQHFLTNMNSLQRLIIVIAHNVNEYKNAFNYVYAIPSNTTKNLYDESKLKVK